MYDPINNQQLCTLQFRWTGWCHKQFWGTGWHHKIFQGTGWRRKQSRKRSKQQFKGSYLHYQRKFCTKIIEEPIHPKDNSMCNPFDWPARHIGCARNPRDFRRAPDGATKKYRHRRSAQWRAHFLDSKGGKPHVQGRIHATVRQHWCSDRQVDSPNPKFHTYLRASS